MKIQNIIFPAEGVCKEEEMYFRRSDQVCFLAEDKSLTFFSQGRATFDTYFNALSVGKWNKYTTAKNYRLCLILRGRFCVRLTNLLSEGEGVRRIVLSEHTVEAAQPEAFSFDYAATASEGLLAFELKAESENAVFCGGWHEAEVDEMQLWETNTAVNICTFRREQFVTHNLDILRTAVLDNPDSE